MNNVKAMKLAKAKDKKSRDYLRRIINLYKGGLSFENNITDYLPINIGFKNHEMHMQKCELGKVCLAGYMSQIINYYTGLLFQYGLQVIPEKKVSWLESFQDNASGTGTDLNDVARDCFSNALLAGKSFCAVHVPTVSDDMSLLDYEKLGLNIPFLKSYTADQLTNYKYSDDGVLQWCIFEEVNLFQETWDGDALKKYTYHVYTLNDYSRFEYICKENEDIQDNSVASLVEQYEHGLGICQVIEMCIPEGLTLGQRIYPLQVKHLRESVMLETIISKNAYPTPVFKLSDPAIASEFGKNSFGLVLSAGDDFENQPDTLGSISTLQAQVADTKNELYRVANLKNLSSDETLQISGFSKVLDLAAAKQSLRSYNHIVQEFVQDILHMASLLNSSPDVYFDVICQLEDEYDIETTTKILKDMGVSISLPESIVGMISRKYAGILLPNIDSAVIDGLFETAELEEPEPEPESEPEDDMENLEDEMDPELTTEPENE